MLIFGILLSVVSIAIGILSWALCLVAANSDRQMAARVREDLAPCINENLAD